MNHEPEKLDELFSEHLLEMDRALERGLIVNGNSDVQELNPRLQKGLACLHLLNNIRKRPHDTPRNGVTVSGDTLITLDPKWSLPTKFGKFELQRELGRGGFGVVFLARDTILDSQVALKMPHSHVLTDESLRARFRREARVVAGMQHPNIVSVHEAGEVGPVSYIVYAYCPGITLADWLRQQRDPVPVQLAVEWVICLAKAVAHAHSRGVLHRDIKPANILLHTTQEVSGAHAVPKITDFGLAKLEREAGHTASGAILGTPSYMAPEQVLNRGEITPAVDVHALGVVLYELLAGHPPFRGESDIETLQLVRFQEPLLLRKLRPKLPRDLETICHKCLEKDPGHRYGSAADLAEDLERLRDGHSIHARPASWIEKSWRTCRRHPVVTGLAACLVLALAAGLTGIIWEGHKRSIEAANARTSLLKAQEVLRTLVAKAQELLADAQTEKPGREMLLEALQYYESMLAQNPSEPSVQLEIARVAARAGGIHHALGHFEEAEKRYHQSIGLFEGLHKSPRLYSTVLHEHTNALHRLGHVYRATGKAELALQSYQKEFGMLEGHLKESPGSFVSKRAMCNILANKAAALFQLKRNPEAEKALLQGIDLVELLLKEQPENPEALADKGILLDDYGMYCLNEQRHDEARPYLEEALAIRQGLRKLKPQDSSTLSLLGRSHWRVGELAWRTKDNPEAVKNWQKSIELNEALHKQYPSHPRYLMNAAVDRSCLAKLYIAEKRYDDAEQMLMEELKQRRHCAEVFPHVEHANDDLVETMFRCITLARLKNQEEKAEDYFSQIQSLCSLPRASDKERRKLQERLARETLIQARQNDGAKNNAQALRYFQRTMEAHEQLVKAAPESMDYRRRLDDACYRMARYHERLSHHEDAIMAWNQAITIREAVVNSAGSEPRDRLMKAWYLMSRGEEQRRMKQPKEAMNSFQLGLDIVNQLEKEGVVLSDLVETHGDLLMHCGHTLRTEKNSDSLKYYLMATPYREKLRDLRKVQPGAPFQPLAWNHRCIALVYELEKRDFTQAVHHYRLSLANQPGNAEVLNNLAWLLLEGPQSDVQNRSEALIMAEKAVGIQEKNGTYWHTLGVARYRRGLWTEAIEALKKSRSLGSKYAVSDGLFLAMAYQRCGEAKLAQEHFDRASTVYQSALAAENSSTEIDQLDKYFQEAKTVLGMK